jgi:predicted dehydrogenase
MTRRKLLERVMTAGAACGIATQVAPAGRAAEPVKPVRVAMVGTGHSHSAGKFEAARRAMDLFEIAGVAEPDADRAKRLGAQSAFDMVPRLTLEQICDDGTISAVLVGSDVREQGLLALRLAKAGKHLHVEKPGGPSHPTFRAIADACRANGNVLQLGYMMRNNPAFEFCAGAVREGWLGTVYEINGVIGKAADAALRKESAEFAGGTMFELGCHLIDPVVTLLGKPDRIVAFAKRTRPDVDALADNMLAVLEYAKTVATIRSAYVDVEGGSRRQFIVNGDAGSIAIRPLEPPTLTLTLAAARGEFKKGSQIVPLPKMPGRYDAQLADFARIVRGESKQAFPIDHEVAVHETLLRASAMPVD